MHLSELFNNELSKFRESTGRTALDILETGTIRNEGEQYQMNDGWSTLTFAEDVRDNGGSLMGIDLSITAAENVLSAHGLRENVKLVQGYSVDVLAEMLELPADVRPSFDVVLLDSDNDGLLIMHEFMVVRRMMAPGALLIIDDVDMNSTGVVKGHHIAPWLDSHGVSYRIETRTGRGYQTGVLLAEI
jgi:cephalosporin hydroxylase